MGQTALEMALIMVYDDRLSQKSLQYAPHWPPHDWLAGNHPDDSYVDEELAKKNFDLEVWLAYKKSSPNDGRSRPYILLDVEFILTKEEFQAYQDERTLCNPVLCPKRWEKYAKDLDEVDKRFWWLVWQIDWVSWGYPPLPKLIWESPKHFRTIFDQLVYTPFIQYWDNPPDDYWVKLSYPLEANNRSRIHQGLVLVFESQGRVFPPPDLYFLIDDPNPESLYLPPEFWKKTARK